MKEGLKGMQPGVGREVGGDTDMDGRTRKRGSTFLQVSGLHIPLFWKILPPMSTWLSPSLYSSLCSNPLVRGLP